MYGYCNDCNDETILTDTEEIKKVIEEKFLQFVKIHGQEPNRVECQIVWKDNGANERVMIKLSSDFDNNTDDEVFYYCNSLEALKSLAEFGREDFIVTDCWEFVD